MSPTRLEQAGAPPAAPFDLESFIPFLINKVGLTISQLFARDVAEHGITVPMWRVLAVLADRGELSLVDLASLTAIDASTLSRLTTTLQRKRLISRRRSRRDKRELVIALTSTGRDLTVTLIPIAEAYGRHLLARLTPEEINTTREALYRMAEQLELLGRAPDPRNT
ncbi:MAG TPA: MarR family winged helix-turn-helix transcriptional regulator [Hyphomicrobiales bacterium]|nr:MarR family winged helix-turn-helix transcriptional regulator [Hyphomicrobiales bacterium]